MGKGKKVTVGYRYKIGWHSVLCQGGADAILRIKYADRVAWEGNVSTNQTVTIDKPKLLGGDKREGGWKGKVDFLFGGDTQPVNDYLAYHVNRMIIPGYINGYLDIGDWEAWVRYLAQEALLANDDLNDNDGMPVPAFRGVVSLLFKSFRFASMNPYMKMMSVLVRRIPRSLSPTYSTITIGGRQHANGAHIIYDVLTNREWGCGFADGDIDVPSFMAAAQTLYNEALGISIAWTNEGTAEEFIQIIRNHLSAVLYPAPDTGKYTLKLIRNDYDPNTLPVLDPSNIVAMKSFQRVAPTDLTNELTVTYHNAEQDKEAKVTVQNLAAIRSVGRIVRRLVEYPGVREEALASRLAMRDLMAYSTPLAKVTLEVNLTQWNLRPGGVFKFNWPKLGIINLICRVLETEYGELRNGRITITAVEDQFGMPSASYIGTQPPVWIPLPNDLANITSYKLFELPYYSIIRAQGEDYAANMVDERNFVGVVAGRSVDTWVDYGMYLSLGGSNFDEVARATFSPWVSLDGAVTRLQTVIPYTGFRGLDEVELGSLGVIDNEWVRINAIDETLQTVTVDRGVLDTVPVTHASGARLWLYGDATATDWETVRFESESASYRLLPTASGEELPISSATTRTLVLSGRQERPYPPGNVLINGAYFPEQVVDDVSLSWAFRDRTLQTADPIPWVSGSIGPEPGATTTVQVYRTTDNTLIHQQTGLVGSSVLLGESQIGAESEIRVELFTVRSALNSIQRVIHAMQRLVSSDSYSARVGADSPVGWWRLSDVLNSTQARDSSGNSRHGVAANVTFQTASLLTPGSQNRAATFNGSSAHVNVPYVAALAPTAALTIECWFRVPTLPTSSASLISKSQTGGYNIQFDTSTGMFEFIVRRNAAYAQVGVAISTLVAGAVYHVVGTYDGRYARLYLDGVDIAVNDAGATYPIQYSVANALIIGGEAGTGAAVDGGFFNGVIDEVSVYGAAIAADQVLSRFKLGVNQLTYREDGFWDKTSLLLHMNGADASTTFTDAKGKTISVFGNAQIDTAQSRFGGASALFDGTGDYLTAPTGVDFQFPGDFTIECWIRPTNVTGGASRYIVDTRAGTTSGNGILLYQLGPLVVAYSSSTGVITSAALLAAGVWAHVAVTRRGSVLRLFVNGALVGTANYAFSLSDGRCYIGTNQALSDFFNGHIDEVRITKACRYSKAFDIPVEAYPDQGAVASTVDPFFSDKTTLLLHMNGADASTTFTDQKGTTVTPVGDAQIDTAQSKFGGASGLFDGAGDYLTLPQSVNFDCGNDFTIECWVRPTAIGAVKTIAGKYDGTGGWFFQVSATGMLQFGVRASGSYQFATATTPLAAATWSYVTATKQGNVMRVFVNGLLAATATHTGSVVAISQVTYIGRDGLDSARDWSGHMDDFRITQACRYFDSFSPPKLPHPDA